MKFQITPLGDIQMIRDKRLDLRTFGKAKQCRISFVELNEETQKYYVQSATTHKILAEGFDSYEEGVAWEVEHFSPGGEGWEEISK